MGGSCASTEKSRGTLYEWLLYWTHNRLEQTYCTNKPPDVKLIGLFPPPSEPALPGRGSASARWKSQPESWRCWEDLGKGKLHPARWNSQPGSWICWKDLRRGENIKCYILVIHYRNMSVCCFYKDQTIKNNSLQHILLFDMNLRIPAEEEVIVSIIKECLLFRFLIYSIPDTFKGKSLSQRGIFSIIYII